MSSMLTESNNVSGCSHRLASSRHITFAISRSKPFAFKAFTKTKKASLRCPSGMISGSSPRRNTLSISFAFDALTSTAINESKSVVVDAPRKYIINSSGSSDNSTSGPPFVIV